MGLFDNLTNLSPTDPSVQGLSALGQAFTAAGAPSRVPLSWSQRLGAALPDYMQQMKQIQNSKQLQQAVQTNSPAEMLRGLGKIQDPEIQKAILSNRLATTTPEYQMNVAKLKFYQGLMGQSVPPGQSGSTPPAADLNLTPQQQQGLAIFDPAGSQALTAAQKLQYETPQAKGATAEAQKTGEDSAEAAKTLNVMQSNLPQLLERLNVMREASKNAVYGYGVNNEGDGWKQNFYNQFGGKADLNNPDLKDTNTASTVLQQKEAQGILPELGPSLAQAGIKGNKFLETIASSASGLNLSASPSAKVATIDGLENQYINNLKATAQQVRSYGGQAPSDKDIDAMVGQYKNGNAQAAPSQQNSINPGTKDFSNAILKAKSAIAAGKDPVAVKARLRQYGIDPTSAGL